MSKYSRTLDNLEIFASTLQNSGRSFLLKESNYTTTIQVSETGKNISFSDSIMDGSVFSAYARIVNEVKASGMLEYFQKELIEFRPVYFDHYRALKELRLKEAVCMDLNAAYPTTLRNLGAISDKLYNYLMSVPKSVRLPAIGMCAGKKEVSRIYPDGSSELLEPEANPNGAIFWYCVKYVGEMMSFISEVAGDYFLFFWVDGIYLRPETPLSILEDIEQIMSEQNFDFSVDFLNEFEVIQQKENKINIRFWKPHSDGNRYVLKEFKFRNHYESKLKNAVISYIRNSQIK